MRTKSKSIPVNMKATSFGIGITIGRSFMKASHAFKEVERAHRDDYHLFILQEKGNTALEIDFHKYKLKPSTLVYIHPTQVHRVGAFENSTILSWAINNESLDPGYLKLLEEIVPAKPLVLTKETFSIISETAELCVKFSERKQEKLYPSLLKDSCNTLIALVISQYLAHAKSTDKFSRFEIVTQAFRSALEHDFALVKSPMAYADRLNISTPYLNECVKKTTGYSVSYHIQQRNILEAKRLLHHTDRSVKEIAAELGYEDASYFIRLFVKVAGMTPLEFRAKNLD